MANENKKDFNAMLANSKDMPKIQTVTDARTVERYGGEKMLLAPPLAYDGLIRRIPKGELVTVGQLREHLARLHGADFTDPMTAGIFVNIVAWASYQRNENITPYWRVLKSGGELNPKYPEAFGLQIRLLEAEGHTVVRRGKKYFVKDFENHLARL